MDPLVRRICLVGGCACITAVSAQVTIGSDDMPSAGGTIPYSVTTTTADMADTGPDHVWDFGDLVPGQDGADTLVTVASTPVLYQFFFNNNLLYPEHHADFAMRGPSVGAQGFSIDDVFDYYKSDATGYRDVGFGATINGLPTSVQRSPVDWIYRFPMDFGNMDSSASSFQVSVPALGFYGQSQMRRNDVDGWGTLYLPADTFEVLRVRSRIDRIDTVHIDQLNTGFAIPEPETIEYEWLAPGMGEPVLQVTTMAGVPTAVRFYHQPQNGMAGIASLNGATVLHAWPNPVRDLLHIEGIPPGPLEIRASDGRVMRSIVRHGAGGQAIDVSDLASGPYILRSAANGIAIRFVVAR